MAVVRRWRFYETSTGSQPVKDFLLDKNLPTGDKVEILAAMADVRKNGLEAARHVRGDIWEVRAAGNRVISRVLFATQGARSQVLLALSTFNKKTQKTPPAEIELAETRLADWRAVGRDQARGSGVLSNLDLSYDGVMSKDDLDTLIDQLAEDDDTIRDRVAVALERRELLRQLAALRRHIGMTQVELAQRMHTSQGQITRLEAGADTRLSTVERYAAALGAKVSWRLEPPAVVKPRSGRIRRSATTAAQEHRAAGQP